MSKYALDLDYTLPTIDISVEELNEIIAEADSIIADNNADSEKMAEAYLKKAQCLYKLNQANGNVSSDKEKELVSPEREAEIEKAVQRAVEAMRKDREIQKAIDLLKKALKLVPDMPEALMRLGTIHSYFSDYFDEAATMQTEAMTMLTKAIQLKPNYAAAFYNRSLVYFRFKNENYQDCLKKAIADLTEAIRIRPFDATYYFNRGQWYSKLGDHKNAFDDFTKVIKYGSGKFKKQNSIYKLHEKAFKCIPENQKTPKMCHEVIKHNGMALMYVPVNLKSTEICLEAIKNSKKSLNNVDFYFGDFLKALAYVPENLKTMEICLEAVKQDGMALEDVPENLKTPEICIEAVKHNGEALKFVPENLKTEEMCLEAVKHNFRAFEYVPENLKTEEMSSIVSTGAALSKKMDEDSRPFWDKLSEMLGDEE